MNIIYFSFARVVAINAFILLTEPRMKGTLDIAKLQGALSRIDNLIVYQGLDDIFELRQKNILQL